MTACITYYMTKYLHYLSPCQFISQFFNKILETYVFRTRHLNALVLKIFTQFILKKMLFSIKLYKLYFLAYQIK